MQNKFNIYYIFGSSIYYPSPIENQKIGATATDLDRNNFDIRNYPGSSQFGINMLKTQFTINTGSFTIDTIERI